jgi:hypothetical protein
MEKMITLEKTNIDKKYALNMLFLAIYFNDTEKVLEIKNQNPEVYVRKNNSR